VAGRTYYIAVDGVSQAYGVIYLSISAPSANDLTVKKLQFKFDFKKPKKDSLSVSGALDLLTPLTAKTTPVLLFIGDLQREFTLDERGKSTSKSLKFTSSSRSTTAKFSVSLKNEDLFGSLSILGFVNADVTAEALVIPVVLVVGEDSYVAFNVVVYKAKAGKSGSAR